MPKSTPPSSEPPMIEEVAQPTHVLASEDLGTIETFSEPQVEVTETTKKSRKKH